MNLYRVLAEEEKTEGAYFGNEEKNGEREPWNRNATWPKRGKHKIVTAATTGATTNDTHSHPLKLFGTAG